MLERLRRTQLKELISRCNDWSGIALDRITSLMKKAWTGRASLFDIDIQVMQFYVLGRLFDVIYVVGALSGISDLFSCLNRGSRHF